MHNTKDNSDNLFDALFGEKSNFFDPKLQNLVFVVTSETDVLQKIIRAKSLQMGPKDSFKQPSFYSIFCDWVPICSQFFFLSNALGALMKVLLWIGPKPKNKT